jgi:hypothetical protein
MIAKLRSEVLAAAVDTSRHAAQRWSVIRRHAPDSRQTETVPGNVFWATVSNEFE